MSQKDREKKVSGGSKKYLEVRALYYYYINNYNIYIIINYNKHKL